MPFMGKCFLAVIVLGIVCMAWSFISAATDGAIGLLFGMSNVEFGAVLAFGGFALWVVCGFLFGDRR